MRGFDSHSVLTTDSLWRPYEGDRPRRGSTAFSIDSRACFSFSAYEWVKDADQNVRGVGSEMAGEALDH